MYAYGQREVIFPQKCGKDKWLPADRKPTPHGEKQSAAREKEANQEREIEMWVREKALQRSQL